MIIFKSANELERMREAGKIVYLTHQELKKAIQPGITTKELDRLAEKSGCNDARRNRRRAEQFEIILI